MISLRRSSSAAWSEIASFGRFFQVAICSIPGITPAVDTVTRRQEICSKRISSACSRFSKLSRGSPMPMKTRFRLGARAGPRRFAASTWATISPGVRLRPPPQKPVTQKRQARAQPAWLEIHRVRRRSSGMSTVSMVAPSSSRNRYFTVPSAAGWWLSTSGGSTRKRSWSCRRSSRLSEVMASKSSAPPSYKAR